LLRPPGSNFSVQPPLANKALGLRDCVEVLAPVTWTETFNCEICGKQKGTVDHWWLAWNEGYRPHEMAAEKQMMKIYPWENMLAHDATVKHLCGQACLQKLVDRWMNSSSGH
jgi:hypothetical protein